MLLFDWKQGFNSKVSLAFPLFNHNIYWVFLLLIEKETPILKTVHLFSLFRKSWDHKTPVELRRVNFPEWIFSDLRFP